MVYRVFLSSTSQDLADHRGAAQHAILGLDDFLPIAMEHFGSRDATASEIDDAKVRACEVFVGLIGHCYGSSPTDGSASYTEQEFELAKALGRPRLMFVASDDFPLPARLIEPSAKQRRQKAFRARVLKERVLAMFDDPVALGALITQALSNWRVDQITAELVAAKEAAAGHEARAAELEQALAEGQKEREALHAAVQALDQRAKEPDAPPTFERALALLREGKTAEAEAIFSGIVADKQAEGAAALQEAAEAARHLAALAYLDDTKKAIEAYATATRLDPDHTWSWIFLGRLYQQAGDLAAAEQAFRNARDAAGRAGNEREVSVASTDLGDARLALGDLTGALEAYSSGLAIAQKLAAQDPGNALWQRDLSVSFDKIGDVQRARGDLEGGLQAYRDSLAIRDKLAAQDPGNAGWQRDLSVSYDRIGNVQLARGDLEGGLQAYRDSLAIREKLVAQDPGNTGWQRDLSVSYEKIGDVQRARGDLEGGLQAYRDSLAIREKLVAQDPGNTGWQRDLSVSYEKIGDVQRARGDLEGGLQAYRDSRAIREKLAAQDPGNALWQRDLSVSFNKIGDVQLARGDLEGGLQAYRDSLAIAEKLAAQDPDNADWQRDLIVSNVKLAEVAEAQQGQTSEAAQSYRAALEIAMALRDSGRLAPIDAWMVDELEARLARVSQAAAR